MCQSVDRQAWFSKYAHSAVPVLQMNAMSVRTLAVTANEKNRHSYRGNSEKGGGNPATSAEASELIG